MKKISPLILLLLLAPVLAGAGDFTNGRWVDLSYDYSEDTIYWPTADTFVKTTVFHGHTDAGFFYTAYNFCSAEHGGTHIDAPIHFHENRNTVDQVPVEQLVGPGVVIRVSDKADKDRNYQLSVEDIRNWEDSHGPLPENSIVLVDTGSGKYWPDKKLYMGTDERGEEAVQKLRFPGIHPEAAKFLATERRIKAVGIDTPSIDFGGSKLFETHQFLFDRNIPGLENVANLDRLPDKGFTIIALPMKIRGGSGGPVRIVAFIPGD